MKIVAAILTFIAVGLFLSAINHGVECDSYNGRTVSCGSAR